MTVDETQANLDTVTSTMLFFSTPAQALFDSGSSRSFVSIAFALHVDRQLAPLKGEQILRASVFKGCEILVEGIVLKANLISLKMYDFDLILGMD